MAFENYQFLSWGIYLLSAFAVIVVTLRVTYSWPRTLRGFIVTTASVLFAFPWFVQGSAGPMAPAVIITFFETFGGVEGSSWMRAGLPLLSALASGYVVLAIVLRLRRESTSSEKDTSEQEES